MLILGLSLMAYAGEPVPGADIFIEQEPDDEPIAHTTTDLKGNFSLTLMLHPGTYKIYFKNAIETKATGNKGGFAIGGFNAALIDKEQQVQWGLILMTDYSKDTVDLQEQNTIILEVITAVKADSKKFLRSIKNEDKNTLVRITIPQNMAPRKWCLKGTLMCVPIKNVIYFESISKVEME